MDQNPTHPCEPLTISTILPENTAGELAVTLGKMLPRARETPLFRLRYEP